MSDTVRKMLREFVADMLPSQTIVCQVVSVDEVKLTCTATDLVGEVDLYSIRLNAAVMEKKLAIIPAVGSYILVGVINNNPQARYMISASEIDKLVVDAKISVVINGGKNGGMCITPKLVTELEKTNQLLTGIITIINGSPITEPGNGAPSALQAALNGAISGKALGDYSQVENEKVKH